MPFFFDEYISNQILSHLNCCCLGQHNLHSVMFTLKKKNKKKFVKKNLNLCMYKWKICIKKGKSTRFSALKIWALAVLKLFDVVLKFVLPSGRFLHFLQKFSVSSYTTGSYNRRLRVIEHPKNSSWIWFYWNFKKRIWPYFEFLENLWYVLHEVSSYKNHS